MLFLLIKVSVVVVLFQLQSSANNFSLSKLYNSIDVSVKQFIPGTRKTKNILIWNGADRIETAAFEFGHEPFVQNGCEVQECVVYDIVSSLPLEEYDAVIVHMNELDELIELANLTERPVRPSIKQIHSGRHLRRMR